MNPYEAGEPVKMMPGIDEIAFRRVNVRPFELLSRAYSTLGDQYWLFFAIAILGSIIGQAVPIILTAPMTVGILMAFREKEAGRRMQFDTLFRGFDKFADSLIARLLSAAICLAVVVVLMIPTVVLIVLAAATTDNNPSPAWGIVLFIGFTVLILVAIAALVTAQVCLNFVFPLIADRDIRATDAIRLSYRAAMANFWGIFFFGLVGGCLSILLSALCLIPGWLFEPILIGANFLLYRDVFGPYEKPFLGQLPV